MSIEELPDGPFYEIIKRMDEATRSALCSANKSVLGKFMQCMMGVSFTPRRLHPVASHSLHDYDRGTRLSLFDNLEVTEYLEQMSFEWKLDREIWTMRWLDPYITSTKVIVDLLVRCHKEGCRLRHVDISHLQVNSLDPLRDWLCLPNIPCIKEFVCDVSEVFAQNCENHPDPLCGLSTLSSLTHLSLRCTADENVYRPHPGIFLSPLLRGGAYRSIQELVIHLPSLFVGTCPPHLFSPFDISPFTSLAGLIRLDVYSGATFSTSCFESLRVEGLGTLAALKHLRHLRVGRVKQCDLPVLSALSLLEQLGVCVEVPPQEGEGEGQGESELDVAPLCALTNLTRLEFFQWFDITSKCCVNIRSITSLHRMLQVLEIDGKVIDASPVFALTSLKRLKLNMRHDEFVPKVCMYGSSTSSGSCWENLSQLCSVDISCVIPTNVIDLGPLGASSALHCLRELRIRGCDIPETGRLLIESLTSLKSLEALHLEYLSLPLSDLSPLTELKDTLRVLCLHKIGRDGGVPYCLSPLSTLTRLSELQLQRIPVFRGNLSPLSGLTSLRKLDIGNFQYSNLSPVLALSELEELNIRQLKVLPQEHGGLRDMAALTNLTRLTIIGLQCVSNTPQQMCFDDLETELKQKLTRLHVFCIADSSFVQFR